MRISIACMILLLVSSTATGSLLPEDLTLKGDAPVNVPADTGDLLQPVQETLDRLECSYVIELPISLGVREVLRERDVTLVDVHEQLVTTLEVVTIVDTLPVLGSLGLGKQVTRTILEEKEELVPYDLHVNGRESHFRTEWDPFVVHVPLERIGSIAPDLLPLPIIERCEDDVPLTDGTPKIWEISNNPDYNVILIGWARDDVTFDTFLDVFATSLSIHHHDANLQRSHGYSFDFGDLVDQIDPEDVAADVESFQRQHNEQVRQAFIQSQGDQTVETQSATVTTGAPVGALVLSLLALLGAAFVAWKRRV